MADYLLDLLDLGAPYLPRALTAPLYTLASQLPSSPSDILHNPSSLLPLLVTLASAYFAFNQFLGTLRWGVRTGFTLLKLGVVGSVVLAVWRGYENIGTEKGVVGGMRDVYSTVERVGSTVYRVGKQGTGWYFGGSGADTRAAGRRTKRSTKKSTNAKKRMWEDPEEVDLGKENTEDFVRNAMEKAKGVWGMFNPDSSATKGTGRRSKRSGGKEGGNGFVWNLLAGQAKKVWEDTVEGMEQPGAKTTKRKSGTNRR
ncbi:uncharacterized protein JCM6883_006522 [Sporobolomyces salmoneus]|uniref:uncharacterized protein n=1 Tax=Sporobolomyces salmoneus TaxID=183962 RepID=UPI00317B88AC